MLFRAIGQNSSTGARMVLEIEANSKGAAEHKAEQAGMYVTHVGPADEESPAPRQRPRRESIEEPASRGGLKIAVIVLLLLAVVAMVWLLWPQILPWTSE